MKLPHNYASAGMPHESYKAWLGASHKAGQSVKQ